MKKKFLVLAIVPFLLTACQLLAPMQPPAAPADTAVTSSAAMTDEDGTKAFAMEGGKMRIIGEGEENEMMMTEDIRLKSGMTVMMNGTVTMADGKTVTLKEGDAVMMDGTVKSLEELEGVMEDEEADKEMHDDDVLIKKAGAGEYKDHTANNLPASILNNGKTKVLYFFASWCPSCKKANRSLTTWYEDGEGLLTVYKINYDEEKALEEKYGVTYQHTFVKVDGAGNMIEKIQGPSDEQLRQMLQS